MIIKKRSIIQPKRQWTIVKSILNENATLTNKSIYFKKQSNQELKKKGRQSVIIRKQAKVLISQQKQTKQIRKHNKIQEIMGQLQLMIKEVNKFNPARQKNNSFSYIDYMKTKLRLIQQKVKDITTSKANVTMLFNKDIQLRNQLIQRGKATFQHLMKKIQTLYQSLKRLQQKSDYFEKKLNETQVIIEKKNMNQLVQQKNVKQLNKRITKLKLQKQELLLNLSLQERINNQKEIYNLKEKEKFQQKTNHLVQQNNDKSNTPIFYYLKRAPFLSRLNKPSAVQIQIFPSSLNKLLQFGAKFTDNQLQMIITQKVSKWQSLRTKNIFLYTPQDYDVKLPFFNFFIQNFHNLSLKQFYEVSGYQMNIFGLWLFKEGQWKFFKTDNRIPLIQNYRFFGLQKEQYLSWVIVALKCLIKHAGSLSKLLLYSFEQYYYALTGQFTIKRKIDSEMHFKTLFRQKQQSQILLVTRENNILRALKIYQQQDQLYLKTKLGSKEFNFRIIDLIKAFPFLYFFKYLSYPFIVIDKICITSQQQNLFIWNLSAWDKTQITVIVQNLSLNIIPFYLCLFNREKQIRKIIGSVKASNRKRISFSYKMQNIQYSIIIKLIQTSKISLRKIQKGQQTLNSLGLAIYSNKQITFEREQITQKEHFMNLNNIIS